MTTVQPPVARLAWSRPRDAALLIARGATLRVSGRVALLVGTVLTAVNQGDVLLSGSGDSGLLLRTSANYATPFLVSSVSLLLPFRTTPTPLPLEETDP